MKIDKLDRNNVRYSARQTRLTYLSESELMQTVGGADCDVWDASTNTLYVHGSYPRAV